MKTALIHTERGLQVRTGAAGASNRELRQPDGIRPAGRNAFEVATRQGNRRWEETYVTAEQAAEFLGLASPESLDRYEAQGHLTPYRRLESKRRLYRREQVERLVVPSAGKAPAHGAAAKVA